MVPGGPLLPLLGWISRHALTHRSLPARDWTTDTSLRHQHFLHSVLEWRHSHMFHNVSQCPSPFFTLLAFSTLVSNSGYFSCSFFTTIPKFVILQKARNHCVREGAMRQWFRDRRDACLLRQRRFQPRRREGEMNRDGSLRSTTSDTGTNERTRRVITVTAVKAKVSFTGWRKSKAGKCYKICGIERDWWNRHWVEIARLMCSWSLGLLSSFLDEEVDSDKSRNLNHVTCGDGCHDLGKRADKNGTRS